MQMASISIWSCSCSYNGWRCSVDDGGARQVAVTVSASGSYSHQQITRRSMAVLISSLPFMTSVLLSDSPALARERRNKKNIPLDQYITTQDGLKYYDLVEGKGPVAEKGSTVQVHFDCLYRGITAVSSRESKLLAGNRIIAQPYEFKVGAPPGKERKREFVDNPNGLFSAQAAPKPPPAMYNIVEGMRVGGKLTQFSPPDLTPCTRLVLRHGSESISFQRDTSPYNIPFIALWRKYTEKPTLYTVKFERPNKRTVIVPAESGYGQRGMNEIPPGATFELNVELLQILDT